MTERGEMIRKQIALPDHLRRFPCLMPWVGRFYRDDLHRRLLVVAESHYLPESVTWHRNPEAWYASSQDRLDTEATGWIHTQGCVRFHWNGPSLIFPKIREQISISLEADGVEEAPAPGHFEHIAFMNFFQRPAPHKGRSIRGHVVEQDLEVAREVLRWFITTHEPELAVVTSVFASKHAGPVFEERGIPWGQTPHPVCAYWHRIVKKYGGISGAHLFPVFLTAHEWMRSR